MSLKSKLSVLFEEPQDSEDQTTAYHPLSEKAVLRRVKSDCSKYSKTQKIITSLVQEKANTDYYVYDPSKNSDSYDHNYHLMFMDNLQEWKNFPKRLNAMICSANTKKVYKESIAYVVIPYDKALIGICKDSNLNDGFGYLSMNLSQQFENMNSSLNLLLNLFNNTDKILDNNSVILKEKEVFYDKDYQTLQNAIARVDSQYFIPEATNMITKVEASNKDSFPNLISLTRYLSAKKKKLSEILNIMYSPKNNGFEVKNFSEFAIGDNKQKELWINHKCLLVKEAIFDKLNIEEPKPTLPEPEETLNATEEPPEKPEAKPEEAPKVAKKVNYELEKKSDKIEKRPLKPEEKKDSKSLMAKLGL